MKKAVAILALIMVVFTIGVVVMNAKSIEKSDECARICAFQHPPHLYPNRYYDCYITCFDGPPLPF